MVSCGSLVNKKIRKMRDYISPAASADRGFFILSRLAGKGFFAILKI
jgi:hypothetical protein